MNSTKPLRRILAHPVNRAQDDASLGERIADKVVSGIGCWRFLIVQNLITVAWITFNVSGATEQWHFDNSSLTLLNLAFSIQAASTGPLLLLASKRSTSRDREMAEHDYQINTEAAKVVDAILAKLEDNTDLTLKLVKKLVDDEAPSA